MMPARLLQPWEVLEMGIQDMKVTSDKGNRYLLVMVDRASKFLTAFPLPTKEAVGVSRQLLSIVLTFDPPCRSGATSVASLWRTSWNTSARWLRVSLDHGPTNHPRARGAVERLGGWLQEALTQLCHS